MTKEISTDAELMSRLLTTQPTPAECLVAAARIEQLAASLTAAEAERDALRAERDEAHQHELEQVRINAENVAARLAAEAKVEKLRGALTPSGETKAAYMGEFSFANAITDEDGNEVTVRVTVPWPTIKEIMAAIRARAALTTEAAHVNETPKSEHDAGNVLTDAALIARLREIQGQAGLFASAAAERIEALRAERDEHAEALKVNNAVLCDALLRIVAAEAVAEKLRAKIAAEARRYANIYDEGTDGRNTFTIFAEWVETRAALTTEADNE